MNVEYKFTIDKDMYEDIFRNHLKYKFRLHRSMYMSVGLYLFGLTMQYGFGMDFGFVNTLVFWIVILAVAMNLIADFYLPKKAYANLVSRNFSQGTLKLKDEGICIVQEKLESSFKWADFTSFIETDTAFLLYKGDNFYIVPKQFNLDDIQNFRDLLTTNISKGRKK